ncbi:arginase family protein, partial [Mycobacterium tuberculosis]|nr:arginase family protein [Mycobacterium tuberculosis]
FWLHLDVDVLADELMPAVDYRLPGGLSWEDVRRVIAAALSSGRLVGLNVTIYNPERDPTGALAEALVALLVGALSG